MSDTPRTDAEWQSITVSAPWDAAAEQMAQVARQLERELDFSEKTGRQIWQANERLKVELEQERQDRKQADLDTIRALGERNDERALADRLAASLDTLIEYVETGEGADHTDAHTAVRALAAWKEARQ